MDAKHQPSTSDLIRAALAIDANEHAAWDAIFALQERATREVPALQALRAWWDVDNDLLERAIHACESNAARL